MTSGLGCGGARGDLRSCWSQRAVGAVLHIGIVLGMLGYVRVGGAQPRLGTPICVPGTPMCASADGHGGIQINGTGTGQVSPSGANGSAQGNGSATGDANANASASGQSGGSGPRTGSGGASGSGAGDVSGRGNDSSGSGSGDVTSSRTGTRSNDGGGSPRYRPYDGRFGVGVVGCPVVRVGVWSGLKAGGCVAVSFRFEGFTFEMETQLLYGGSTHAFDWTFPLSFVIPLANERSLFEGGYLRFGGSPVGATFARKQDGGSFVRFGLFAGSGYELRVSDAISWRVIDARLSFDMGTRRAMDSGGHWVDLGVQVATGLVL